METTKQVKYSTLFSFLVHTVHVYCAVVVAVVFCANLTVILVLKSAVELL